MSKTASTTPTTLMRFRSFDKNLDEALKAANISGADGSTYNRNAKAAARSAFESKGQRFFESPADGDEMPYPHRLQSA